jgi:hypothetical protein
MYKLSLIFGSLFLLTLIACENTTNSTSDSMAEDEEAINQIIKDDDMLYEEIGDASEDAYGIEDPSWLPGTFAKEGFRMRFGRKIESRNRNIEVVFTSDTTATAYISRKYEGKFISLTGEWINDTTFTLQRFAKPLVHNVDRVVNLVKYRDDANVERRNWKRKSVSMAEGKSRSNSISIVEMVIKPQGQDSVVITNPTEYFINGTNIFTFPRFTDVTVRVKIENNSANLVEYPAGSGSTENVRLQYGRNRKGHHAKAKFEYIGKDFNGYQVYEGHWQVRQFSGIHHAVVDVIDNGSILYEDNNEYPYNSITWGTPYTVTPF